MKKFLVGVGLVLALGASCNKPVEPKHKKDTSSTQRPQPPSYTVQWKEKDGDKLLLAVQDKKTKKMYKYVVPWYIWQTCEKGETYRPDRYDGGCGLKPPQ